MPCMCSDSIVSANSRTSAARSRGESASLAGVIRERLAFDIFPNQPGGLSVLADADEIGHAGVGQLAHAGQPVAHVGMQQSAVKTVGIEFLEDDPAPARADGEESRVGGERFDDGIPAELRRLARGIVGGNCGGIGQRVHFHAAGGSWHVK